MNSSEARFLALNHWLNERLDTQFKVELISGDASFRRYYRITTEQRHYILMDSPPELLAIKPFIEVALAYNEAGVLVPELIDFSERLGAILLTDLGDTQLLSVLSETTVTDYYQQALAILPAIASVTETANMDIDQDSQPKRRSETAIALPSFDDEFIHRELGIFVEWFALKHLQITLTESEYAMLQQAFSYLAEAMLEQPQVGVHRDYHSRNLMLTQGKIAVIDFQDAVVGPITYDSVSLLKDCYIQWPREHVLELASYHFELCRKKGLLDGGVSFERYIQWFDITGLQRHLKVLGIFSRLNYRDQKPAYMADIPLVLSYVEEAVAQLPQLEKFKDWLANVIRPAWEKSL